MTKREAEEMTKMRTVIRAYQKRSHSSNQKNKDVQKSRDKYKAENKELKAENKRLERQLQEAEELLKKSN